MSKRGEHVTPQVFVRVPAGDVARFVETHTTKVSAQAEAQMLLDDLRLEAERIVADTERRACALDLRIERQAEETAEKAAQKYQLKQNAMDAKALLSQAAIIADDYANLKGWLSQAVHTGVERVVGAMPRSEQWANMINQALSETKQRWELTLVCHPSDFETLHAIIDGDQFNNAVAEVRRDPSMRVGVCCLQGSDTFAELSVECRLAALKQELDAQMSGAPEKVTER